MSTAASGEYKLGGMNRRMKTAGLALLLAAGAAGAALPARLAGEPAPATPAPVSAVWVEHEFRFTYVGFGTYYSCAGLSGKVEDLLRRLGAREDLRVRQGCVDGGGVELVPSVRITAFMPAEATPERLAPPGPRQSKGRAGRPRPGQADRRRCGAGAVPGRVADGHDQTGRRDRRIEDGDCELLKQIYPQVLEKMGVRMVPGSRLNCAPRMSQNGAVLLRLQSLQKTPEPDATPAGHRRRGSVVERQSARQAGHEHGPGIGHVDALGGQRAAPDAAGVEPEHAVFVDVAQRRPVAEHQSLAGRASPVGARNHGSAPAGAAAGGPLNFSTMRPLRTRTRAAA